MGIGQFHQLQIRYGSKQSALLFTDTLAVAEVAGILIGNARGGGEALGRPKFQAMKE